MISILTSGVFASTAYSFPVYGDPADLVAAYSFNEGAGTTSSDSSGNGNAGSISGPSWTADGYFGSALSFDGVDDIVTIGDDDTLDLTNGMTLEAWIKPATLSGWKTVMLKERESTLAYSLYAVSYSNKPRSEMTSATGTYYSSAGGSKLSLNTWTHLAATYDGSTLKLYVNGVEVSSKAAIGSISTSSRALSIGGNNVWSNEFFNGIIDEVRIYNKALTQSEIQQDMATPIDNSSSPPPPPPLPPPGDTENPAAPANLSATASLDTIDLNWNASTDNVGVTNYNVHRSTSSGFTPTDANRIAQPTSTSYTDPGLPAGTYYYLVTAEDAAGNISDPSNEASATATATGDPLPPAAPFNLSATGSLGTIDLSWFPSIDNVGVTNYNVHRSTSSGFTPTDANRIAQPTSTSYTDPGLPAGTYYYLVTAEDAAGNISDPSNEASATATEDTPPPPADTTPPTISVTDPANGSTVSGTITVSAIAADNVGVVGVQFLLDGVNLGTEDLSAPYSIPWNTDTVANGSYTITARARDAAGNQAESSGIDVTVSNQQQQGTPTGLVAAYPFNEGTGSTADDASGYGNIGSISGASWTVDGYFGNALSFDGVDDIVSIGDDDTLDLTSGMTLEAWVKPSTLSGWKTVMLKERPGTLAYALYANNGSNRPAGEMTTATGAYHTARGTSQLSLNSWTHLAVTYDGSTLKLYVNGVETGSKAAIGSISTSSRALSIGGNNVWSNEFVNGIIDEVRIYNKALTQSEIQQDMVTPIESTPDDTPPTAPTNLSATGSIATVDLDWDASTDDNRVIYYNVHRSTSSGFTPTDANRIGQPTSTSYTDPGLAGGTYYYLVTAEDAAGNISDPSNEAPGTATADSTPPTISDVGAQEMTDSSATVTWVTDEPSTSQVEYGTTTAYGSITPLDSSLLTIHDQLLNGLDEDTLYHYRVISRDAVGNEAVSGDFTFRTIPSNLGPAIVGEWSPVMNWPIIAIHAAQLPSGEILMMDGWEFDTTTAKLWDPDTNQFTTVDVQSQLFCSAHSMLADGRLLVVGGHNGAEFGIADAFIFDSSTNSWSSSSDMNFARWYPSSTTLGDGRVVVIGGQIDPGVWASKPEVYDPDTDTWTLLDVVTSNMRDSEYPLTFLLPSGKLFSIGAVANNAGILDVDGESWTGLGALPQKLGSAVMYRPSKVLYAGGGDIKGSGDPAKTTASVIDLTAASPGWQQTSQMSYPRYEFNLVMLADGKVMAVGGADTVSQKSPTGSKVAEIWDPDTGSWTTVTAQQDIRQYHSTAMLLPDGRVLSAGGGRPTGYNSGPNFLTGEIYSPPYLFKGPRPTITCAPSIANLGGSITVQTPDASDISKVSLIRLAAVTHTLDMNQRYVELDFTVGSNELNVEIPSNPDLVPPGYYMLFIVNDEGVPSVAAQVRVPLPSENIEPQDPCSSSTGELVAAYSFDEGSGTTSSDSSGNGNTGSISGPSWTADGYFGSALSFDGVDDMVSIGDDDTLDLTSGMTLEAWVKPSTLSGWKTVMLKERPGTLAYSLYAVSYSNKARSEIMLTTGAQYSAAGGSKLSLNTWTHLAATYDGSTLKLYINGVEVGSKAVSGNIFTSSGSLSIGGNNVWSNEFFNGIIDEVRIYNKALTQSEIQQDMVTPIT